MTGMRMTIDLKFSINESEITLVDHEGLNTCQRFSIILNVPLKTKVKQMQCE